MGRNIFFRVFVGLTVGMLGPVWGSPIGVTSGMSNTVNHDTTGGLSIVASVSGNPTGTFSGLFSGAGKLTIGNGTLPVTVDLRNLSNSYSGGTDVLSGSTVIVLQGTSATPGAAIAGGTSISLEGGTIKFQMSDGATPTITNTITLTGGGTLSAIGSGAVYQYSPIHGTGGLTIGEGSVTFAAANNYTGGTTVASGATLYTSASTSPSSDTDGITLSGGVVNFTGGSSYGGPVTFSTYSGSNAINSDTLLTLSNGGLTVPSGVEVDLSNINYKGPTVVDGGILNVNSLTSSGVTLNNGGDLIFYGEITSYDGPITGGNNSQSGITNADTINIELSGNITGSLYFQWAGGTLELTGTNSYHPSSGPANELSGGATLLGTTRGIQGDISISDDSVCNVIFKDSNANGTYEGVVIPFPLNN